MPAKKKTAKSRVNKSSLTQVKSQSSGNSHFAFWPVLIFSFVLWLIYRSIFNFPVWFDETLGKAIFFGLPVWCYVVIGGAKSIITTYDFSKIKRGLLVGLAFGGIFGFVASIMALLQKGGVVINAELYMSDYFWWEFLMAMFTSFWETLFFFSFVMVVVMEKYKNWPVTNQVLLVALIFLVFHLPNSILRFSGAEIVYQAMLMLLFGIGQGFLFSKEKNAYALIISQALWGMVLLVHF